MDRRSELHAILRASRVDREALAKLFEEAPPEERIQLMESIDGREQARLWVAAEGGRVSIDAMVPRECGALVPVIFHGKNSLPLFTRFQKRFCRPPRGNAEEELWGYNHQPVRWLAPLTGPGYFVAYDCADPRGSVAVDYRRIPTARPADWPELHDNRYRLSRLIYNGMVDYLRRVSDHLLIGRATRGDRETDNYFLLCREDPSPGQPRSGKQPSSSQA
ncbi:MAG: hypothetical protein ACE5FG_02815 [Myxococcota bacterium]